MMAWVAKTILCCYTIQGYYDAYIARCLDAGLRPNLVSLSFSCQLCENIPVTDRDRNVDRVILP